MLNTQEYHYGIWAFRAIEGNSGFCSICTMVSKVYSGDWKMTTGRKVGKERVRE